MISFKKNDFKKSMLFFWLTFAIVFSYVIIDISVNEVLLLLSLLILFFVLFFNFKNHYFSSYILISLGFLVPLLSRLVSGVIFGLFIDSLLVFMALSLFLDVKIKLDTKAILTPLPIVLFLWFFFTLLELINPLSTSKVSWFYANRAFSIYPFVIVLLTLHFFKHPKKLKPFLMIWGGLSIFGTLWGIKQLFFGVSALEQIWLDAGAAKSHVLFGKLRVFSFFTDAAQFGASQAHAAIVFGLISLKEPSRRNKIIYWLVALFGFYGMIISGTRGVLSIIFVGLFTYALLSKKLKTIVLVGVILVTSLVFLKFTTFGNSNYQMNRVRTALNFNDPSFMIRINRIKELKTFMVGKPLGFGIGSGGYWANRFYPNGPQILKSADSYYISLWMQTGIVGLLFKIILILFTIFYLGWLIINIKNDNHRQMAAAFFCAYCGFLVADFTNTLSIQLPSSVMLPMTLGLIYFLALQDKKEQIK